MSTGASSSGSPVGSGRAPTARGGLVTRIGEGEIGGKARGLVSVLDDIAREFPAGESPVLTTGVPPFTVVTTDVFDSFIARNDLRPVALSDRPNHQIAHAFQKADLPPAFVGSLRAITDRTRSPLAVRSSSLLEDALFRPFAGVYQTKMTPNNQLDPDERFRKLCEAIKLVWASTFFAAPKRYIRTTGRSIEDEKMAVVIQEIVGRPHGARFYPTVSGVAASYNFYPAPNIAHEEGVVNLALGLGKTIVDGGSSWFFPPRRPASPPPFGSIDDMIDHSQSSFWAVNIGPPPPFNPVAETEYLRRCPLADAEADGVLGSVASTYDAESDRVDPGLRRRGPRIVNFAPVLGDPLLGFTAALPRLLGVCERRLGGAVEIEFALNLPDEPGEAAELRLVQVRPMALADNETTLTLEELTRSDVVLASSRVIGNTTETGICDIVYVRREGFAPTDTPVIAEQVARMNAELVSQQRPYVLIGFGRWGSSDPWGGIPVTWDQIAGARVIVEATLPNMNFEMSQGSHFFHNLISFRACYLMVPHYDQPGINWAWLDSQPAESESGLVRHLRLPHHLLVMVDGRSRRGVIRWTS
ncbi:MAG: hypothetical protein IT431_01790 [Phycisphaerales bacterium]|nr:hypothetical protein [Phycisphaerales bacterium]